MLIAFATPPFLFAANTQAADSDPTEKSPSHVAGGRRPDSPVDEKQGLDSFFGSRGNSADGAANRTDAFDTNDRRVYYLIVAMLVFGGLMLFNLKRLKPTARTRDGSRAIQVIARTAIGPKQAVCLVRVAGRIFVLGTSSERLCLLSELTDPKDVVHFTGEFEDAIDHASASLGEGDGDGSVEESRDKDRVAPFAVELGRIRNMVAGWRYNERGAQVDSPKQWRGGRP